MANPMTDSPSHRPESGGKGVLRERLDDARSGPLANLVILELASGLAANHAGALLADLGAYVIKVETWPDGDPTRTAGHQPNGDPYSLLFASEARGTFSVALDLSNREDRTVFASLAAVADGLIEDLRPGTLEDLDLSPSTLRRDNPGLSVLRLSPFGQTGPLSAEAGDDRIAQAFSGVTNVTGYPDIGPMPEAVPIAEYWTGIYGAASLLTAVLGASRGIGGQDVDLAYYETALRLQEEALIQLDQADMVRTRMGNEYPETVPSNHYETADGRWVAISAAGSRLFAAVCEAIEQPAAADDPRFSSGEARINNRDAVNQLIGDWVGRHDADDVIDRFTVHGAPIALVASIKEIVDDPHTHARDMILRLADSRGGGLLNPGVTPRITRLDQPPTATPPTPGSAPRLDEHGPVVRRWHAELSPRLTAVSPPPSRRGTSLPLAGLRVIDLGRFIAAPFSGTILGEFGAEVIKVEAPGGDDTRVRFPIVRGVGLSYLITNRGKKSVTLDLHRDEARALLLELVGVSDVVLENFRPGTLERWGLGPEELKRANPNIIVVRASGFGQFGPNAGRTAFDRVGLAAGGMSYLGGLACRPPLRPGVLVSDYSTGLFGLVGALAALNQRDDQGVGAVVDVSLFESVLRMTGDTAALYGATGHVRERNGAQWPMYEHAMTAQTADGNYVTISATDESERLDAMSALGLEVGAEDHRPVLTAWLASVSAEEAVAAARKAGLMASEVNTPKELLDHPHLKARGNITRLHHHILGEVVYQGVIPRLSATPGTIGAYSREPGSHNREVYGDLLGHTAQELAAMKSVGAI
jgi:formyl-CoA transferase